MFPCVGWSVRRVLLPVAHKVAYARAYESPFRLHVVANKGAANKGANKAQLDAPSPVYPRSPCRRLDCCAAVWFFCNR